MLSRPSLNVISAKVRAMYGERITMEDYSNMLNCRDLKEVVTYLKNNTYYEEIINSVDETNIYRSQLETLIKRKMFDNLATLCRYQISTGESFSGYIISKSEIEKIIHSLMFLASGKSLSYIYSLPLFFDKHTKIDLQALVKVKDYNEFLEVVKHSEYKDILEGFKTANGEDFNLPGIEGALYSYLYEKLNKIIEANIHGIEKEDIKEIFNSFIDYSNFVRLLRIKRRKSSPDFAVINVGTLTKTQINDMLEAETEDEIFDIMKTTKNGGKLNIIKYNYIDQIPWKIVNLICRRKLRASSSPSAVMLSYIFLMEIELSNIINIMEGIRYGIGKDEIKKLLIIKD